MNEGSMNQEPGAASEEMRPEYDIQGGIRGKYYERYREGTNVVLLNQSQGETRRDVLAGVR